MAFSAIYAVILPVVASCFAGLALASCSSVPSQVSPDDFSDVIDGKETGLWTISCGDIVLQATNYGGRVVSLSVPDRNGNPVDVVLGHRTLNEYVNYKRERFLGAVVGPVANRIVGASYTYGGRTYRLSANHNGKGMLHGGFKGLDSVVWDFVARTDSSLTFHCLHPDGAEGFPGNLDIYMTYTLTQSRVWKIDYKATTDAVRPVNISNHPYFNLGGEGSGDCKDYILYVNADSFLGTDGPDVIESPILVDGTVFDYRKPHPVRDAIESNDTQIVRSNMGFDHNFCIKGAGMREAASLYNPSNGIRLSVWADQPGLQLYSGQWWTGEEKGKNGKPLERYGSFTFETQNWPDAPNKPSFPDPFLEPGETYTHHCEYRFSSVADCDGRRQPSSDNK